MTQTAKSSVLRPSQRQDEVGTSRSSVVRPRSSTSCSSANSSSVIGQRTLRIALLTGGGDKPYALGMATALTSKGVFVDFIGSDDLNVPAVADNLGVRFFNLRGDQSPEASSLRKIARVTAYYWRLIRYAVAAKPKLFHILWNNKFELFDRTLLMLYYELLGKKVVLTLHNVNRGKRDSNDSWLNRFSLKIQYGLSDHILVHTEKMKRELLSDFDIQESKVSVIPFGINNTVPNTALTTLEAKKQLGVSSSDKTVLFFGNIAPYKGLEYLVAAFTEIAKKDVGYRLIIVGKPKGSEDYWNRSSKRLHAAESGIVSSRRSNMFQMKLRNYTSRRPTY